MSPELCAQLPELNRYGFYRRLNDGKLEFISFCKPEAKKYVSMHADKFNKLLDELLPEKKNEQ